MNLNLINSNLVAAAVVDGDADYTLDCIPDVAAADNLDYNLPDCCGNPRVDYNRPDYPGDWILLPVRAD